MREEGEVVDGAEGWGGEDASLLSVGRDGRCPEGTEMAALRGGWGGQAVPRSSTAESSSEGRRAPRLGVHSAAGGGSARKSAPARRDASKVDPTAGAATRGSHSAATPAALVRPTQALSTADGTKVAAQHAAASITRTAQQKTDRARGATKQTPPDAAPNPRARRRPLPHTRGSPQQPTGTKSMPPW